MAKPKISVLIVDDERAARERLRDLLVQEDDVEIVGTASNGREAVERIERLKPDLVFLDVQMPGLTGLEVVQQLDPQEMPEVIFVTAYNQYAVNAFEVAAIDYLLKPFEDERFEQALSRVRQKLSAQEMNDLHSRLADVLRHASENKPPEKPRFLERIAVEMRGQMRIVPVERIAFIAASGDYAELHTGNDTYVIREQMQVLEDRLDPGQFFRIHRSTIVRLEEIDALLYSEGGDYAVRLHDGKRLKVSRSRYEELQQRLGIASKA